MSYPLTMPVSMPPPHYVNGRLFELNGANSNTTNSNTISNSNSSSTSAAITTTVNSLSQPPAGHAPLHLHLASASHHQQQQPNQIQLQQFQQSLQQQNPQLVPYNLQLLSLASSLAANSQSDRERNSLKLAPESNSPPPAPLSASSSQAFLSPAPPLPQNVSPTATRRVPARKQSVFVAPTGISALREMHPLSGSGLDPESLGHLSHSSHSLSTRQSSPSSSRSPHTHPHLLPHSHHHRSVIKSANNHHDTLVVTSSSSSSSSSTSSSPSLLYSLPASSISSSSSSLLPPSRRFPSNELISQHISQLILNNEAVITGSVPGVQAPGSKRSHSVSHLPTAPQASSLRDFSSLFPDQPHPSPVFVPTGQQAAQMSHLLSTSLAYSKLHSALLGENRAPVGPGLQPSTSGAHLPSHLPVPDVMRNRKYSEMPYSQYAHLQMAQNFQQQQQHQQQHPTVIVSKHLPHLLPHLAQQHPAGSLPAPLQHINSFNNSSNSNESLVRNLLISKVSPFVQLDNPNANTTSLNHNGGRSLSTTSTPGQFASGQSSDSIIKDLLLKSRSPDLIDPAAAPVIGNNILPSPPQRSALSHKRSRTESINDTIYPCVKCRACFRSPQTLECHQEVYCKGNDAMGGSQTALHTAGHSQTTLHPDFGPSSSGTQARLSTISQPSQRRVSVLDRPSVITFRPDSPISSLSTLSACTANSSSAENLDNFGNILKNQLLSSDDSAIYSSVPFKKRKISEPAFRHSYSNEFRVRDSKTRFSTTEAPRFSRNDEKEAHPLEILPAYSPHLNRQPTKITLQGEILFPILKELIVSGTNHEFNVCEQASPTNSCPVTTELFAAKARSPSLSSAQSSSDSVESEVQSLLNDLVSQIPGLVDDSIESVAEQCLEDILVKVEKKSRPNSLTLTLPNTFQQSARNVDEVNITSDSLFLNRRSVPEMGSGILGSEKETTSGQSRGLVSSNLISPDMPRSQRKCQQLYIDGSAYTNLGLKVSTKVTFCCLYRPQPMFVTQEANPQLSMYSEWTVSKLPAGDILELVGVPSLLFAAHNSSEAVLCAERAKKKSHTPSKHAAEEGERDASKQQVGEIESMEEDDEMNVCATPWSRKSSEPFQMECKLSVSSHVSLGSQRRESQLTSPSSHPPTTTSFVIDRLQFCLRIPLDGKGFADRVLDTQTTSQLLSAHSQAKNKRKNQRNSENMIQDSVSGRKLSVSSSNFTTGSVMGMHPMLGHLGSSSKEKMLYIMMMSQMQPVLSVPSRKKLASSCNLISRKFSECIGMRQQQVLQDNWSTRIGADGVTELIPKRIRIFEGGFKSNEDYTYVRGRGRGKYVCEECGIRCKKPSMLKKHIRTHTDLRPYSCRHCAFAFKTKGNLTKHMKSKAHHKKCVELGISPVPTTIDDSQIDSHALARQEQYELACSGDGNGSPSSSGNPLGNKNYDYDDESDFEDDDFDEDDDEGVPITSLSHHHHYHHHPPAQPLQQQLAQQPSPQPQPLQHRRASQPSPHQHLSQPQPQLQLPVPLQPKLSQSALPQAQQPQQQQPVSQPQQRQPSPHQPQHQQPTPPQPQQLSPQPRQQQLTPQKEAEMQAQQPAQQPHLQLLPQKQPMLPQVSQHCFHSIISLIEKPTLQQPDNDQPIDLSMPAAKRVKSPEAFSPRNLSSSSSASHSPKLPSPALPTTNVVPSQKQPTTTWPDIQQLIAAQQQQQQPHTQQQSKKFGLVEMKQITQDIVRAFSPLSDLNSLSLTPQVPSKSISGRKGETSNNNTYKSIRTEEFALLSPGVHTPHRLPVNFRVTSDGNPVNNQSRLKVVVPSPSLGSSLKSPSSSAPNPNPVGPADPFITSEEKAVCHVCSKTFNKQSQLSLHLNIHNFERPFRCDSCGVSFQKKGHLQKHCRSSSHLNKLNMNNTFGKATSDNPRPFKCADCAIAFRIHGHLAKHLRSKVHILKLEYLGKLPFGMYSEMERLEIPLGPNSPIDTTDCKKALESLRKLQQKLYDPGQIIRKVTESSMDENYGEEDDETMMTDEEDDLQVDEDMKEDSDEGNNDAARKLTVDDDSGNGSPGKGLRIASEQSLPAQGLPSSSNSVSPAPSTGVDAAAAGGRSSTCDICSKTFKSSKSLQAHLYTDHPDEIQ